VKARSAAVPAAVALLLAGCWFGARWVSDAAPQPIPQATFATYRVQSGTVAKQVSSVATLTWTSAADLDIPLSGRVTAAVASGSVAAGDVLLAVDGESVLLAVGAVPAFRDLVPGSRGPDVRQLQDMLRRTVAPGLTVDGTFGKDTTAAVDRLWRAHGSSTRG